MPQGWTEPNSFHVCITSYKQFFRGYAALTRVRWRCLVIDEMQRVKGLSERHWEAVFTLQRSAGPPGWGARGLGGWGFSDTDGLCPWHRPSREDTRVFV